MRLRHWRLLASFVVMVAMPIAVLVIYLWSVALDQYSSVAGFTVRKEEGGNTSELIGGLAQIAGSSLSSDSDILYEFIHSQSLVRTIENEVGLIEHYSDYWDEDPVFALWRDPSIEDLEWYWRRIVRVSYDANSGLIEVRVLAFTPEKAQEIAQAIVRQSEDMINRLSEQAREDAMRYARNDLEEVVERLKRAREALTAFRSRTQIVDPEADLQGRMGVMNNLQQQLATALVDYDLLLETTHENDPRLAQGRRRIEVIRERIAQERKSFATRSAEDTPDGEDYPSLIAEYEGLVVDREFTEETYRASLAALDLARANAQRESRYLATYIQPTLAESSEYPRRFTIAGLCGLFLLLSWSVLALVYYSIRDRA
ncbi:sugar transporter [Paracoccus alkanivorans]|uniref:Sugar transporter n=2 Tax=Paracoccus alkanivorans TaxID=2116655 RepID=A0A3M0MG02_9RHOB|nr:sugar transporter [Paracoccus alkanivorans]